jgi:Flp pilus assembly protein TadG
VKRTLLVHGADSERGAAAVEFALVLPLLLMLVFGMIDYGRAYNEQITLTQLAREGARLESLGRTDVKTRLISAAPSSLGLKASDITETACVPGSSAATDATVVIHKTFTYITPVAALAHLTAGPLVLTGKASMPCLG